MKAHLSAIIIAAGLIIAVSLHACTTRYKRVGYQTFDQWTGKTVH